LSSHKNFHYLNKAGTITYDEVEEAQNFESLKWAMTFLGIEKSMQQEIFNVVAAILHLGNIIIIATESEDSFHGIIAEIDPSSIQHLQIAANLLGVDVDFLQTTLTVRTSRVRGETLRIPLKPGEVIFF
jgi:myosin heavy subunit